MIKMSDWVGIPNDITSFTGFCYIIICQVNQRYYIGQKKFWFKRKLKPLKGKKNSRHKLVESDWRTYYGSSKGLQSDIDKYGTDCFTRKCLFMCKSKAEMNYYETKEQFFRDVLFDPKSYNNMINCRIGGKQIKNLKK